MTNKDRKQISFDDFDELHNPGPEQTDFEQIVDKAISRRGFLGAGLGLGAAAFVLGTTALTPTKAKASSRFSFEPVAANSLDTVTVPKGYSWHVVSKWGDPLWSKSLDFDHKTRGTGESQELAFGDNNDGMALFAENGRDILVVNNEYTNRNIIYGNRESELPETADDIRKGKAAHGITVAEIAQKNSRWSIVKDSDLNRRITADTPMEITGPARGHALLQTAADATGTRSLGTWNNCGNGRTPWGTYLACEENFNGYFSSSDENYSPSEELKRYGVKNEDWGYGWAREDERFDISKNPNEPNRAGYIVEFDPRNPSSTPKKRTALGRFKHENAEVVVNHDGHVVVYMGDDERGEFIYRFVSESKYSQGADNSDLLETGRLYVAKFHDDQTGEWLELTPETTGMASQAEVCVHSRLAGSAVGATTMDRPEWVAAHPKRAEIYCALTNNKNRGKKPNAGGDETAVGGPNPRAANLYGQIVRWKPENEDHTSAGFRWDLFVMAGNPTVHKDAYGGSENVNANNMFNSPDGISFDNNGMLWIQTDGKYSNEGDFAGMGNNQMLIGDTETGEIQRFLVGPKECEVTGITWSGDRKTVFVGIQHPGEEGNSHFPEGGSAVPRSSVIAVTRDDGAVIG
ncbi:PhoX family phosphatase [Kiloniella laminariae]|uniref:PhoX family phosphatase n=1 Tax=Kiloniella laminariae TaxID=454162 RepID=A0ABT4LN96_9PROT|nr:PhoX family phosphatase [Kiloniella laminariae]MCZ4282554.1 PhoX family phosphatase [Kiloniella laminariae]